MSKAISTAVLFLLLLTLPSCKKEAGVITDEFVIPDIVIQYGNDMENGQKSNTMLGFEKNDYPRPGTMYRANIEDITIGLLVWQTMCMYDWVTDDGEHQVDLHTLILASFVDRTHGEQVLFGFFENDYAVMFTFSQNQQDRFFSLPEGTYNKLYAIVIPLIDDIIQRVGQGEI